MLVCPNCNNRQEDGKFCGVCGSAVELAATENANEAEVRQEGNLQQKSANEPANNQVHTAEHVASPEPKVENVAMNQAAAVTTAEPQGKETLDQVKVGLSNYWSYFVHIGKNPARAFQHNENQFVNGLVTLGLYAILFSLSIYFLGNSLMSVASGFPFMADSLPFFSVVTRLIGVVIILFAISFGSAFIMAKAGKIQDSFKQVIAQYGALIVPFTAINTVAMLGGLIGSVQLTLITLAISTLFTFIFIPVLFVYEKVSETNRMGQKIYLSLATVVIISVVSFLLGDALIINLIDDLDRMF